VIPACENDENEKNHVLNVEEHEALHTLNKVFFEQYNKDEPVMNVIEVENDLKKYVKHVDEPKEIE